MANGPRWACCLTPGIKPIVPKSNHRKLGLKYWGEAPQKRPKSCICRRLTWKLSSRGAVVTSVLARSRSKMKKVEACSSLALLVRCFIEQDLVDCWRNTVGAIRCVACWMWHASGLKWAKKGEHRVQNYSILLYELEYRCLVSFDLVWKGQRV